MKAFKITDPAFGDKMIGFVVAEDIKSANLAVDKHCEEMEDDDLRTCNLSEMTKDEFNDMKIVDEHAKPNGHGEYPIIPCNYNDDVVKMKEAYVFEFDR